MQSVPVSEELELDSSELLLELGFSVEL